MVEPLLPNKFRGVPRVDDRRVLNGNFWVLRLGAPWRVLPERYGPRTTCQNRFVRWRKAGPSDHRRHYSPVWWQQPGDRQRFHPCAPTGCEGKKGSRDHCFGRSRGGLSTKIYAVFDGQGHSIRMSLTVGQSHDSQAGDEMLDHLGFGAIVLVDKDHGADRIRVSLRERGEFAYILPKANRSLKPYFSTWLYHERNLIERFFPKLKNFRRVATRYDKLAESLLAMIQLATVRLWLRTHESKA